MIEAIVLVFSVVLMYVIFPTKVHVLNTFYVFVISVILICLATFRTLGSDKDLLKSKKNYIHSLYNVLPSFLYICLSSKKIMLDIHGIVPEENKLINKNFRYLIFNFCERIVFTKEKLTVMCVTNHMINFYKKYKTTKAQFVRYIIFPNNLEQNKDDQLIKETKNINIVYSGNFQK